MKMRVVLAFGLLALVLIAGYAAQYRMELFCDELRLLLKDTVSSESFLQAKKKWNNHVTALSVMIRHDRVDNITEAFSRAEAFLAAGTNDEFRAEVAQIISKLTWLREYDRPSVRSVF